MGRSDESDDILRRYVVAACCTKISDCFAHPVSKAYCQSLELVPEKFPFNKLDPLDAPTKKEKENDRDFLIEFVWTCRSLPQQNGGALSTSTYSNLLNLAEEAANQQDLRIYNENTCQEFHKLFIQLLQGFYNALSTLSILSNSQQENHSSPIAELVEEIVLLGGTLQGMTRGSGLRMHLKNIQPFLQNNLHASRFQPTELGERDEAYESDVRDEELEELRPYTKRNAPDFFQSYWDWFRLMMVHFQAVDVLTGPRQTIPANASITFRLVTPPRLDLDLLPWPDLISTLPGSSPHFSNQDILDFLKNETMRFSKWSTYAAAAQKAWKNRDVQGTITNVECLNLEEHKLCGWDATIATLLQKLRADDPTNLSTSKIIDNTIDSLSGNTWLFSKLNTDPIRFKGSLHCEATLASLLYHQGPAGGEYSVVKELQVTHAVLTRFSHQILISCNIGLQATHRSIKTLLPDM